MKFKRIRTSESVEFKELWKIYSTSFPPNEKRSLGQQRVVLNNKNYRLVAVYTSKEMVGLLMLWDFDGWLFIDHLAVKSSLRGKGIGTKILSKLFQETGEEKKGIVLETQGAQRRRFYERLGFKWNTYSYIQPPFSEKKQAHRLFLMTYPKRLSKSEFNNVRNLLHTIAYGLEKSMLRLNN